MGAAAGLGGRRRRRRRRSLFVFSGYYGALGALCAQFGPPLCVPALRTPVRPCCVHGVLVQFVVDMCVLEPMPLRVPMLCVLELCAFVLGVRCAGAAFV